MSQQQINRISAQKYLEKAQDTLQHQAHLNYLKEHFRVGNDFDKHKFIFSYLYSKSLCTDDCEVINWVDRKIRGKLEGKIKFSKDGLIEPNTPDIIINNNYYNIESVYQDVDW